MKKSVPILEHGLILCSNVITWPYGNWISILERVLEQLILWYTLMSLIGVAGNSFKKMSILGGRTFKDL